MQAEDLFNKKRYAEAEQLYRQVIAMQYLYLDVTNPPTTATAANSTAPLNILRTMKPLATQYSATASARIASMKTLIVEAQLTAELAAVDDLIQRNKPGMAYARLKRLTVNSLGTEVWQKQGQDISQKRKTLTDQAEALLNLVKAAITDKDSARAQASLKEYKDKFGDYMDVPELKKLYADLTNSPELKELIRVDAAAEKLKNALKQLDDKRYSDAMKALEDLAKQADDLDAGKQAAAKIKEIQADKELMRLVDEDIRREQCEALLKKARNFTANGLRDEAEKIFKDVIARYPDTEYAKTAAEALENLKKAPSAKEAPDKN